jgi:hypothetical protein
LNHKAVTDHRKKYLDVMHELLLKHGNFDPEPARIVQLNPSSERVIEYYDIDSECREEYDNVRECDSDNDHFFTIN